MAREQHVTLRAQWLGQQLRAMRENARLTLRDLASQFGRDASWASRLESGIYPARLPDVLGYLDVCGIDDPRRRDDLRTMASDIWQKGWWDGYAPDLAGSLIDLIWLESRAVAVTSFESTVLPGLLQTRQYAEALIRADIPHASDEQIQRFVDVRMTRQQRLNKQVKIATVIDEGAVRRLVGGPEVLRAQLAAVIEMANQPHVEVRILPAAAGAHASPDGAFQIVHMRHPYPSAGCVSTIAGNIIVEGPTVNKLTSAYDRLRDAALPKQASVRFLADLMTSLE